MDSQEKMFYSITEAAAALNVSRRTVQNMIYDGRLESVRIGNKHQIPTEALRGLIDAGRRSMQK